MNQQTGGAAQPGQQAGGVAAAMSEDLNYREFGLNDAQVSDLQRFRREAIPAHGDNALCVLLLGRGGWSPQQIESLFGIAAGSAARAGRAFAERGVAGVQTCPPANYVDVRRS